MFKITSIHVNINARPIHDKRRVINSKIQLYQTEYFLVMNVASIE